MAPRSCRRGTTLVELLVAVVFIGLCAAPIIACVRHASVQSSYAQHREQVFALVRTTLQAVRAAGRLSSLTVGTVNSTPSLSIPGASPSMAVTTALEPGYTDLYRVQVTVSWTEQAPTSHTDSVTAQTFVRAPN